MCKFIYLKKKKKFVIFIPFFFFFFKSNSIDIIVIYLLSMFCREQMLQVLLRITEAVMKRPQDNQRKDSFAESLASLLFRVWLHLVCYTLW